MNLMGTTVGKEARKYRHHPVAFKREVVEASMKPGVSVAQLALEHGVNANQVWAWRKQYREGSLLDDRSAALVAVEVVQRHTEAPPAPVVQGSLEIVVGRAQLRVTGRVDLDVLKTAIAALQD